MTPLAASPLPCPRLAPGWPARHLASQTTGEIRYPKVFRFPKILSLEVMYLASVVPDQPDPVWPQHLTMSRRVHHFHNHNQTFHDREDRDREHTILPLTYPTARILLRTLSVGQPSIILLSFSHPFHLLLLAKPLLRDSQNCHNGLHLYHFSRVYHCVHYDTVLAIVFLHKIMLGFYLDLRHHHRCQARPTTVIIGQSQRHVTIPQAFIKAMLLQRQ